MFHPDLHEHDPEKRKTYELLTQASNEARDRGDIELLELIAKDPQAFILKQGWAGLSLDGARGLMELRALERGRSGGDSFASRFAGEMNFAVRWRGGRVGDRADRIRAAGGVGDGDRWLESGGGADCGGGAGAGG